MSKETKSRKPRPTSKFKAKLLGTYYGHPIKDMKLICITGTTGKVAVAHFVHEIMREAGQRVAVLASDESIKVGTLHKFFSDAWKAGANYVIVTTPADSLEKGVFYGLPIHVAAMTDFLSAGLDSPSAGEYVDDTATLFDMSPEIVVLNTDDANYPEFKNFAGTVATVTYGHDHSAAVDIEDSKLYKLGTEATLNISGTRFNVATFLTGEPAVSYMAAAAAIATALHIAPESITDGIAAYDPESE